MVSKDQTKGMKLVDGLSEIDVVSVSTCECVVHVYSGMKLLLCVFALGSGMNKISLSREHWKYLWVSEWYLVESRYSSF